MRRGFTFHEHLDSTGLIHMNGRIYDPHIARFLSPDPHLSEPWLTQASNRYSYVYNSPLSATDPSGFDVKEHRNYHDAGNAFNDSTVEFIPEVIIRSSRPGPVEFNYSFLPENVTDLSGASEAITTVVVRGNAAGSAPSSCELVRCRGSLNGDCLGEAARGRHVRGSAAIKRGDW